MDSNELEKLKPNRTDYIVSGLKSLAGAILFGETLVGELFGNIIPNQLTEKGLLYRRNVRIGSPGYLQTIISLESPEPVPNVIFLHCKHSKYTLVDRISIINN